MCRRVVITGIGMLTPLGNTPDAFYQAALAGKSGIRRVRKFDTRSFCTKIGGEIFLSPDDELRGEDREEFTNVSYWSAIAAKKAVADAHLSIDREDPYSIDVILGISTSAFSQFRAEYFENKQCGFAQANFKEGFLASPATAALQVGRAIGSHGETTNISSACSSSTTAIGYAFRMIQNGYSDCVVTGGTDEGVSPFFFGTFGEKCLSKRNNEPDLASRPFDRDRDGYVLSDAACILVLEEFERAKARGADIYCELSGYGSKSDGVSAFKLGPSEEPGARAIDEALRLANVTPGQVDYYCAMGISGVWLDRRETKIIKRSFSKCSKIPPVSSVKSMTGHPQGASGALQVATSALAIRHKAIPPTINHQAADSECDLDYVPNEARCLNIKHALVYSLGNGHNDAVVLSAV